MSAGLSSARYDDASGYAFLSVAYASIAEPALRMSAIDLFCFARCIAVRRFGMAIAARMPITATSTRPPSTIPMTIPRVFVSLSDPGTHCDPLVGLPQLGQAA